MHTLSPQWRPWQHGHAVSQAEHAWAEMVCSSHCGNKLFVIRVFVKHNEVIYPSVCKICLCEKHAVNAVSSSGSRAETCLRQRPFWLQEARTSSLSSFSVGLNSWSNSTFSVKVSIKDHLSLSSLRLLSPMAGHCHTLLLLCWLATCQRQRREGTAAFRNLIESAAVTRVVFIELKLRLSLVWNTEATDSDKKQTVKTKQTNDFTQPSFSLSIVFNLSFIYVVVQQYKIIHYQTH